MQGRYIVIEGIDGSGKDTVADKLTTLYSLKGQNPLRINEPSDSNPIGRLLRTLLLEGSCPKAHAALFLADRTELLGTVVEPALQEGRPVICVRSFLSTLVYQQEHWDLDWLISLHTQMPAKPDTILVLDLTVPEALMRGKLRGRTREYYEREGVLMRVRDRYLRRAQDPALSALLRQDPPGQILVVDGSGTEEEVFNRVKTALGITDG